MVAFVVALAVAVAFVVVERRGDHPMVPPDLFRSRTVGVTVIIGFAFMVGYYGLPFVVSLYLQQYRGLSALQTGLVFAPMMIVGALLTPFSARIAERLGRTRLIVTGLTLMALGLAGLAALPATTPRWLLSALMLVVGLGGPTVAPPATAVLLDAVPAHRSGTASGVFNTSRQLGGALAVAVFGGLLADPDTMMRGVHLSLAIAALMASAAAIGARVLPTRESVP